MIGVYPERRASAGHARARAVHAHRRRRSISSARLAPVVWASRGLALALGVSMLVVVAPARPRPRQRHVGLRLHRGDVAHAVHGQLVLGAADDAVSARRCPCSRASTCRRSRSPGTARICRPTTSMRSSAGCSRSSGRASSSCRTRPGGSPSSRASRSPPDWSRSSSSRSSRSGRCCDVPARSPTCSRCSCMPIVLVGVINRVKARWAGRRGPPILQLAFDLVRLAPQDAGLQHGHHAGVPDRAGGRPGHGRRLGLHRAAARARGRSSRSTSTSSGSRTCGRSVGSR